MKCIVSLTSLALVSLSSIAPCLAANQILDRDSNQSSSSLSLSSATKTVQLAFGLGDVIRTIDRGLDIVEQEKRRGEERVRREQQEKERQERLEASKKRQEELQVARKEATERQRLEADRRQKYFESLSPEEQKAYIAEQRAIQKKNSEVAAKLFLMIAEAVTSPKVCRSGSWFTGYTYYDC